jgi:hypothetical protein
VVTSQGILTCLIGIIGYFFIINFPDDAHKNWNFLSAREIRFVLARVNADRGDAVAEPWSWAKFLLPALDLKTWAFGLIFGMTTTVTYALAFFLPIILHEGMGFSVGASQCLVAPPYAAAALLMYASAWFGDKYRMRGVPLVFNTVLALIGLPLLGFAKNLGVRYFGVFLVAMGSNANVPTTLTYQYVSSAIPSPLINYRANNIRGHWKRAFCSATLVGMGGVGGIIGSLVFRSQDSPSYHPGLWACIASQLLILVLVGLLDIKFYSDNKKADRGEKVIEGIPGFRYTL